MNPQYSIKSTTVFETACVANCQLTKSIIIDGGGCGTRTRICFRTLAFKASSIPILNNPPEISSKRTWRWMRDSNPRCLLQHTPFPREHHRPLGQSTNKYILYLSGGYGIRTRGAFLRAQKFSKLPQSATLTTLQVWHHILCHAHKEV